MQEIPVNPTLREKLHMFYYWPSAKAGEPNIGYGSHRTYMLALALGFCMFLAFFLLYIMLGRGYLLDAVMWIWAIVCFYSIFSGAKYTGYYEVDETGTPIRFFSPPFARPESIVGRKSVSRKTFVNRVRESQSDSQT